MFCSWISGVRQMFHLQCPLTAGSWGKKNIYYLHLSSYIFSWSNRDLTIKILCHVNLAWSWSNAKETLAERWKNKRESLQTPCYLRNQAKTRIKVCLLQHCMKQPSQQQHLETILPFKAMNNNYSCCQKNMTILNV